MLIFAFILLAAGSGTTWKQMGITMLALFDHPDWLAAVRDDRAQLRPVVEESLRWMPTDPMFSRFVARDTELAGIAVPEGAVVHMCLAAANRDPARWERPGPVRPRAPGATATWASAPAPTSASDRTWPAPSSSPRSVRCSTASPICDSMNDAPAPRITGMYERGPTSVPVRF